MKKRLFCLLLCLCCITSIPILAEAVTNGPPEELLLDERSFLPLSDKRDEYIWQDEENGLWQYVTKSLFIRVTRKQDDTPRTTTPVFCFF